MKRRDGPLPRMEARPRKDGRVTYRYHPPGGRPITLGTDRAEAIRRVLDLTGRPSDEGTVGHLWRLYTESPEWRALAERTQRDYEESARQLLRVFGHVPASLITRQDIRRYLTRERGGKVRANREIAVLSNLMHVGIDYGYVAENPCVGVRRLKERPRRVVPVDLELDAFLSWLRSQGGQWSVIAGMAEFAARTGSRRTEFLRATRVQVRDGEARLIRAKQRDASITDVIELSPELRALIDSLSRDGCEYLFPSRRGVPYTDAGFKAMFSRAMRRALAEGVVSTRFTFHDLRAYYATAHKAAVGALPDLHADPGTTARVYERSGVARRKSL
ncbi:MAG: site-specific integrase [Burkholderiaceae bacterium]|nr:site-specific integrase [Burkholderiaceae bacterium]